MTGEVVPQDPQAGSIPARLSDAHRIFNYLRERTRIPFETHHVQVALGILQGFSTRFAHARRIAREHGELITNAKYIDGRWVFWHEMPSPQDCDDTGHRVRTQQFNGQAANLAGQAQWYANNHPHQVKAAMYQQQVRLLEQYMENQRTWDHILHLLEESRATETGA